MLCRGPIHVHSRYSDGEFTLAELRDLFLKAGCSFACLTDHAEAFDSGKRERFLGECQALSDADFCFVPGLEYECRERMHVLGYGCTLPARSQDPQSVMEQIQEEGGIAVIAHPAAEMFEAIGAFSALPDGIEVWNSKYDGRYAPRAAAFRLLFQLQQRKPKMLAFYGQDLHWRKQFRGLLLELACGNHARSIIGALRAGAFCATKGMLRLPSDGRVPDRLLNRFAGEHDRSEKLRQLLRSCKAAGDRLHIPVNGAIKAQLRRIL